MEIVSITQVIQNKEPCLIRLDSYNYFTPEKQSQRLKQFIPHPVSINLYEQYYRLNFEQNSSLHLRLFVNRQLYEENLEECQFIIQICYKVKQPVAGFKFVNLKRMPLPEQQEAGAPFVQKYCFTEYFIQSSSTWLPSQDTEILFERVAVTVKSAPVTRNGGVYDYMAVCSGSLVEEVFDEAAKKRRFIFENRVPMKPDFIGVVVGQFQSQVMEQQYDSTLRRHYVFYGTHHRAVTLEVLMRQLKLYDIFSYLH